MSKVHHLVSCGTLRSYLSCLNDLVCKMGIIMSISSPGQLSRSANGRTGIICTQAHIFLLLTKMLRQGSPHQICHSSSNHTGSQEGEAARYGLHAVLCWALSPHLSVPHLFKDCLPTCQNESGSVLRKHKEACCSPDNKVKRDDTPVCRKNSNK